VRERCADLFLDTVGVGAAATILEPACIARDLAVETMAAGTPARQVQLPFDGRLTSAPGAAFAFAT